ncbi:MAG TPA: PAS domain S-box protein [Longimicrobiales bacterium]|nr:PAS domain S-box protein [Longimicrobiales bacterium]
MKKDRPVDTHGIQPYGLLHELPGAAAMLTSDGVVVAWNADAAELLGWRAPLRAPRLGTAESAWLRRLLAQVEQQGQGSIVIGHRRGDERIAVELRVRSRQGGELLVLMRECRSQLRARRARKDGERRLRQFLDRLPDPVLIEQNRCIAYANNAAAKLIGEADGRALAGQTIDRFVPEHVRARAERLAALDEVADTGPIELLIDRPAAQAAIMQLNALPLQYRRRPAMQYLLRDVTEHRQTQAGLRATHERLRVITDVVRDYAIMTVDPDQRIVSWNASAERLTCYSADDIIHVPFALLHAGTDDDVNELFESAARSGRHEGEMDVRRQDGSTFAASVTVSALHDPSRDVIGYVIIVRDLTERLVAEENLRRSEEQLRHSQKMDAVGRLAAGIAHDFNNILTAIQGHAQFLLEDLPAVFASREDAVEIKRAADRATDLTRQLLTFARRQPAQPVALEINDIILDVEKMLRRLLPADVNLEKVLLDVPPVFVDSGQLEQVVMNLVVNARDAMPNGGTVTIRTSYLRLDELYAARGIDLQPGEYVQLSVSDTGHGMTADVQRQIFEPFFTTKSEGTGLGLSTVYGIVQQARGHISVYSEEGMGTTFKVYLPVAVPAASNGRSAVEATAQAGVVLLVEDDDAVRTLARRALQQRGFEVLEAGHGAEALALVADDSRQIDVVVTDLTMPGIRGDELADRIRTMQPGVGIVLMSGYTEAAAAHAAESDQRRSFLEKPFTPDSLVQAVRGVLSRDP